jgi:prepilin-type processing-associated H-X9-DG protein
MYYGDNHQRYPDQAYTVPRPHDWVFWQSYRTLSDSAIARYLDLGSGDVLRCPSDDVESHRAFSAPPGLAPEPYPYSYIFNFNVVFGYAMNFRGSEAWRPAGKIMLIEADPRFVDSGRWDWGQEGGPHNRESLLGNQHDASAAKNWPPDGVFPSWSPKRPDLNDRGNAAFFDCHVEYVTRATTMDGRYNWPWGWGEGQ